MINSIYILISPLEKSDKMEFYALPNMDESYVIFCNPSYVEIIEDSFEAWEPNMLGPREKDIGDPDIVAFIKNKSPAAFKIMNQSTESFQVFVKSSMTILYDPSFTAIEEHFKLMIESINNARDDYLQPVISRVEIDVNVDPPGGDEE